MFIKLIFSVLLLGASMTTYAKDKAAVPATPPPAKALTAKQQALQTQLDTMGPQMVKVAVEVAQMIDQNKIGEIWDEASPIAKAIVPKDDFIKQITADRAAVGPLTSRELGGVSSSVSDGKAAKGAKKTKGVPPTPAGTYISVAFTTRFTTNTEPVRELVSFHLDDDQKWRVAGYTLR